MKIISPELQFWLALLRLPGVGAVGYQQLIDHDITPPALFALKGSRLKSLGLNESQVSQIRGYTSSSREGGLLNGVEKDLLWLRSSDHHVITWSDSAYPPLLREIPASPPVLYVKGDPDLLRFPQIAIVGSRHPTRQGQRCSYDFARYFSQQGFICTSGLALGVDGAAHEGALAGGGSTIAVLAHGLDQVYPKRHLKLAESVAASGALVSEFPIGIKPLPHLFPRRNRIISGLSTGTLVVEAAFKSGSLITAKNAADQGREVFAIPGSIHSPLSRGCHNLIQQGAKLVEKAEDVIEELKPLVDCCRQRGLGIGQPIELMDVNTIKKGSISGGYPEGSLESVLLKALDYDPMSVDELTERTGFSTAEINSGLVLLELDGVVEPFMGGYLLASEP